VVLYVLGIAIKTKGCFYMRMTDSDGGYMPGIMMPRPTPVVKALMIALAASFVAQTSLVRGFGWSLDGVALSWDFVSKFRIWQIVTYMFLHANIWHLLFNILPLYFLGPEVERTVGSGRFIRLYLLCGIVGGLGWLIISARSGMSCVGASGAIYGIVGAFAGLYPRRPLTILFYFFPITMQARTLVIILALISIAASYFGRLGGVAHMAHLAGGLAGYFYGRRVARYGIYGGMSRTTEPKALQWLTNRFRRVGLRLKKARPRVVWKGDETPSTREVDRVLDKLANGGWSSLSSKDRDVLERASRK
jgi:membrane associated rhomboid family serine protease